MTTKRHPRCLRCGIALSWGRVCGPCKRERRRETDRAYYAANREKIAARQRAYRARNPEKTRAISAKWRANHPGYRLGAVLRKHGLLRRAA